MRRRLRVLRKLEISESDAVAATQGPASGSRPLTVIDWVHPPLAYGDTPADNSGRDPQSPPARTGSLRPGRLGPSPGRRETVRRVMNSGAG